MFFTLCGAWGLCLSHSVGSGDYVCHTLWGVGTMFITLCGEWGHTLFIILCGKCVCQAKSPSFGGDEASKSFSGSTKKEVHIKPCYHMSNMCVLALLGLCS